ncbi:MAG: hypothetical protein ACKE9I_07330 [Methylophagaceae bacterium]
MTKLSCQHCGGDVESEVQRCPNCGIPLPPDHGIQRQKKFILWFIALIIFCFFMMFWLPPDWSPFIGK